MFIYSSGKTCVGMIVWYPFLIINIIITVIKLVCKFCFFCLWGNRSGKENKSWRTKITVEHDWKYIGMYGIVHSYRTDWYSFDEKPLFPSFFLKFHYVSPGMWLLLSTCDCWVIKITKKRWFKKNSEMMMTGTSWLVVLRFSVLGIVTWVFFGRTLMVPSTLRRELEKPPSSCLNEFV